MPSKDIKILMETYIQGKCTPEEEAYLYEWFDQNDPNSDEHIFPSNIYAEKEKRVWTKIREVVNNELKVSEGLKKGRIVTILRYIAAACVLLFCLALEVNILTDGRLWFSGTIYTTTFGETKEISLPDGSIVTLNSMSELKVPNDFADKDREMYLEGEAYFKVKHDTTKPFIVFSKEVSTKALGTEFDVSAYKEDKNTLVSLKKGKVEVKQINQTADKPQNKIILHPGEEAFIQPNKKLSKRGFSDAQRLSWKTEHSLVFSDADIDEVLEKLQRHYGVTFDYSLLKKQQWKLTGEFKEQSLEDVLASLEFNYHIGYKISGSVVTLFNKSHPQ